MSSRGPRWATTKLLCLRILKTHLTPEEYLAIERKAEYKSEYFQGEMFAMAGGRRHGLIVTNLLREPSQRLRS
jgi:Uma2 family endonuclease